MGRSSLLLGAIACLAHVTVAGCRADGHAPSARTAGSPGAERAQLVEATTGDVWTTEGKRVEETDDSSPWWTEGCRSERPDAPPLLPHAELVEVRRSSIPTAGDGLFAKADIPADTYLGDYVGLYLIEEEIDALTELETAYLFEIPSYVDTEYETIAGDLQHYVSKVNFAPSQINGEDTGLQNVQWALFCDEPYVRLYSARDIAKGEELYADYGPAYDYGFMEHPPVQEFFLAAIGASSGQGFVFEYSGGPMAPRRPD